VKILITGGAALQASAMGLPYVVSGASALSEPVDRSGSVHRSGSADDLLRRLHGCVNVAVAGV
jgi:hypothetical protein